CEIGLAGGRGGGLEAQPGGRRVMAGKHTGRGDGSAFGSGDHRRSYRRFDLTPRQRPGPQLRDHLTVDSEDGGFEAGGAGAAVEDGNSALKSLKNLRGSGRGEPSRRIGGGGGQRHAGSAQQRLGQRVSGDAEADGIEAGGHEIGEVGAESAFNYKG